MIKREIGTGKLFSIAGLVLGVIFSLNCFTIISTGSEASVESFGEVHENKILTGFNGVLPWWGIDEFNLLHDTNVLDDKGIPSKDKFKTNMDISYTGSFLTGKADAIRGTTGTAYQFLDTHIGRKVLSCTIKAGGTVESSQEFFSESVQISMADYVVGCVNDYVDTIGGGYEISQVQFTDIRLAREVREFMVLTKQRQEGEEQQESQLRIADLKAQEVQKVSNANKLASIDNKVASQNVSDAKFYDMKQEALGNAELQKSLSPELVRYVEAQRWDGKRSHVVAGAGTELLIDTRK